MTDSYRLNLTLDDGRAAKLRRLADSTHLKDGTLARSLLSTVLDQLDTDPSTPDNVVEILDGIPGALERAQLGQQQGRDGLGHALSDL